MAAKQSDKVTVVVEAPYQVCFDGTVYMPGDEVTVPSLVAVEWRQAGWVT